MSGPREHGGGIDAARERWGGARDEWIDLSTGINPVPYPIGPLPERVWTGLPDHGSFAALESAARAFWSVPAQADLLAAPGASALIARIPAALGRARSVTIPGPTYNEHAAAFSGNGWHVTAGEAPVQVVVHPNNPDGRLWNTQDLAPTVIVDESFCDVVPDASLIAHAARPGVVVLKSFGKFWGLAGLRLGFAIGDPALIARLRDTLGPWQVSGPGLAIGTAALRDPDWAQGTRARLARDAERLDRMLERTGCEIIGGTTLFRLIRRADAGALHERLARRRILTRSFSYAPDWLRFGLPGLGDWDQLEAAL